MPPSILEQAQQAAQGTAAPVATQPQPTADKVRYNKRTNGLSEWEDSVKELDKLIADAGKKRADIDPSVSSLSGLPVNIFLKDDPNGGKMVAFPDVTFRIIPGSQSVSGNGSEKDGYKDKVFALTRFQAMITDPRGNGEELKGGVDMSIPKARTLLKAGVLANLTFEAKVQMGSYTKQGETQVRYTASAVDTRYVSIDPQTQAKVYENIEETAA